MDVARAPKQSRCPRPPCSHARPPASRFPGWTSTQATRNQAQPAPKPGAALGRGGGKQLAVRQGLRGPWRSSITASRGLLNAGCNERVYFGLSILDPGWQPGLCCRGRSEPPPSMAGRGGGGGGSKMRFVTHHGGRVPRPRSDRDSAEPGPHRSGGQPRRSWAWEGHAGLEEV